MKNKNNQNRSFGILFFIVFVLIGIWPILNGNSIRFWSIFIAIIFFAGVQLIFMGLLGEYIGKVLKNVNKEPQYSIDYIKLNEPKK